VYRGDCNAKGLITLKPTRHARCIVVHIRRPVATVPSPPKACATLVAGPRVLAVGPRRAVVAHVTIRGKPLRGAQVEIAGAGVSARIVTLASGRARFAIRLRRPGILVVSVHRQYGCPPAPARRLGVAAARAPSVTG
jgi:hypothetical protein